VEDFDLDDLNHVLRLSRESSGSGSSVKRLVRFVLQLNDKLQETRNRVKGMDEELDSAQSDIAELKKKGEYQCFSGEATFHRIQTRTIVFPVEFASRPALAYGFIKLVDRTNGWVTYSGLTTKKVNFNINKAPGALRIQYIACGIAAK